jgi:hypothetical protein
MKIIIDTDQIKLAVKDKIKEVQAFIVALYRTPAEPRKIEVQHRGLATGQVVAVRRPERRQIKVKYVPSK